MPVCRKCNKSFKNLIKIDGKIRNLHNRRYCIECSPFDKHNTKNLERKRKDPVNCTCSICTKEYVYIRGNGSTLNKCASCIVKDRKEKIRIRLIKENGSKCNICGYNKSIAALDFHHKDPKLKEYDLSSRNMNRKYSILYEESKKCILICSNCHRELHCSSNSAV